MKKIYSAPACEVIASSTGNLMSGSGLNTLTHQTEIGSNDFSAWYEQPTDVQLAGDGDTEDNKAKGNNIWEDE
jgi:hypothetical protein